MHVFSALPSALPVSLGLWEPVAPELFERDAVQGDNSGIEHGGHKVGHAVSVEVDQCGRRHDALVGIRVDGLGI